jgi:hypothetical protein
LFIKKTALPWRPSHLKLETERNLGKALKCDLKVKLQQREYSRWWTVMATGLAVC